MPTPHALQKKGFWGDLRYSEGYVTEKSLMAVFYPRGVSPLQASHLERLGFGDKPPQPFTDKIPDSRVSTIVRALMRRQLAEYSAYIISNI